MAIERCRACGELYVVDSRYPHICPKTARRSWAAVVTFGLAIVLPPIILVLAVYTAVESTRAAEARDPGQVRAFRRLNPCPATGQTDGACPGWVVDHIIPLAVYGPDRPDNMQWQRVEAAKAKDKLEYEAYRARVQAEKDRCRQP